ncbi:MAG: hypothetical protein H7145_06410 [Akkermansiaceae bacterium]|nr:hypothetical protein [Armatimonadota bacterium]
MLPPNATFSRRVTLTVAFIMAFSAPVFAQSASGDAGTMAKPVPQKRLILDLLRHDPKRRGPLLFVAQYNWQLEYDEKDEWSMKAAATGMTPAQFAERTGRRAITVGDITAFVPPRMSEFVKSPAKPDPYAGLHFDQRFVQVLGSLSRAQWKQAGSANGIGVSDLTEEQRALFAGLWRNEPVKIRTVKTRQSSDSSEDETESFAVSQVRFRLSRRVSLRLRAVDSETGYLYKLGSGEEQRKGELQGDGSFLRQEIVTPIEYQDAGSPQGASAFGVPVIVSVPNRLKSGQLPLEAPALNIGMRLDGSHRTVGELIAAVSKATRFRLVADTRLASLPIGYRLTPGGQVVSTGDILKALCRSVTGTFRRLDGPGGTTVYLLTDDVEGIGTRFARLDRWAEKAAKQRSDIHLKAINDCSEKEPLDALGFAPGYAHALSPDQMRVLDDSYRSQDWARNLTVPASKLSPALQEEFKNGLESWSKWDTKVTLRNDAVGVDTDFHCDWVLPGGRTIPAQFNGELDYGFLRQIAAPRSGQTGASSKRAYKNPLPTGFPPLLKCRILTAQLPDTEEETRTLFGLLARKGFRETWLRVGDSDPATRERLEKAVSLGKAAKIRVGVIIPWLLKEDKEAKSDPDVNILGETGNALFDARLQGITDKDRTEKQRPFHSDREAGWVVLDSQDIAGVVRRVSPFVKLADLSAVVFTNTAAPGYDSSRGNGSSQGIRMLMGYNAPLRFRCVMEKGFDPVDVVGYSYNLGFSPEMPFFRPSDMAKLLAEFRRAQNRSHLARIHDALQGSFPQTPLYIHATTETFGLFAFYGRWAKTDGFAEPEDRYLSKVEQMRVPAFRAFATPVFALQGVQSEFMQGYFWNAWHDATQEATKGWGGFALDMLAESSGDPDALLKKLPDDMTLPN